MDTKNLFYTGLVGLLLVLGLNVSAKFKFFVSKKYDQIFVNETPYQAEVTVKYNWGAGLCSFQEEFSLAPNGGQNILAKRAGCGMVKRVEAIIKKPRLDGSGQVDMITATPWKYTKLFYKWDKTGTWRVREVGTPAGTVAYEVVNDFFKGGF